MANAHDAVLGVEDLEQIVLANVPPARGRQAMPLAMDYSRDLVSDDIAKLSLPLPVATAQPGVVARLRHGHHALARLLAEGRKAVEISEITGYSQSRISILKSDPAFCELVEYYRGQVTEVYLDMHSRLATLGITAMQELQERLEDNPERLSTKEVREIMDTAFDRSIAPTKGAKFGGGNAPAVAVNVTFVKSQSESAPMIDVTPKDD